MKEKSRSRLLLRAFCIWTVFVWAVLIKNMITSDESISFRAVHIGLAVISIAFALSVWPLARRIAKKAD